MAESFMGFPRSSALDRVAELERMLERSALDLLRVHRAIANRVDPVTALAGSGALSDCLRSEWRRAAREGTSLSLLNLRVADFAAYGEALGDLITDLTLRQVADAVRTTLRRPGDFLARIVGAEFGVVLPRTNEAGALNVAARIRGTVEGLAIPQTGSPGGLVTVAVGVSSAHPWPESTWEELDLLAAARRALIGAESAVRLGHILSRPLEAASILRRDAERARQHPRAAVDVPALSWAERRAQSVPVKGRFTVLGAGGAELDTEESYAVGGVLSLSFSLPAPANGITCRAIVRDRPGVRGVGVEFLDIHPNVRARITSYVAGRLPGANTTQ